MAKRLVMFLFLCVCIMGYLELRVGHAIIFMLAAISCSAIVSASVVEAYE